jgi:predicted outer membrane repeat protein
MFSSLPKMLGSKSRAASRLRHGPAERRASRSLVLDELESRDAPVTDLYVTSSADSGPGTLRAAVAAIFDNDPTTIHIQVSAIALESEIICAETGVVEFVGETPFPVNIHPAGGFEHDFRFMTIGIGNGGNFLLDNLQISDFGTSANGGAVWNRGTLTVAGCHFASNFSGGNGGAIASTGLNLTLLESSFADNVADLGGAVYFVPAGVNTLEVTDSEFQHNIAELGGGIYTSTQGTTDIEDSHFHLNVAVNGAAIYHYGGILQIVGDPTPILEDPGFAWISYNDATAPSGAAVYTLLAASIYIDCPIKFNLSLYDVVIDDPQSLYTIHIEL